MGIHANTLDDEFTNKMQNSNNPMSALSLQEATTKQSQGLEDKLELCFKSRSASRLEAIAIRLEAIAF